MRLYSSLHTLLIIAGCLIFHGQGIPARAEQTAEKSAVPELTCKEPIYEFGTRDNMDSVDHTFVITNTGTAPLVISKVQAACSCTVVNVSKDHLEPGEQSLLTAKLSLKGQKGKVQKSITIQSNDPTKPSYKVLFQGSATATILFTPSSVRFQPLTPESDDLERTVDLIVDEKAALNILKVTNSNDHVQVTQETVKGGTYYQFHIKLVPPLPVGLLHDIVKIKTDSERYPELVVPVTAKVIGAVAVTPEKVLLPASSDQPLVRYVLMSKGSVDNFKVESVKVPDDSGIEVEIKPLAKSGYRIRLSGIHPDAKLNGQMITIATDIPAMPLIELPIEVSDK